MNSKDKIISMLQQISGTYSPYDIFVDWVTCMALSIQNTCYILHDEIWKQREKQYLDIIDKYDEKERDTLTQMCALLTDSLEEDMQDVLGYIYMQAGCGNKNTGQFFTPFHISIATASLAVPKNISEMNPLTLYEPSVGGGGMIIASAKVLFERKINYQKAMKVVAQDLDWKSVYMTYVQTSLLGINAIVIQGNTLQEPYIPGEYLNERTFRTPNNMGMLI